MTHPDAFQVLIALDQLINTFFGGMADETLSARAYRHALNGTRRWPRWLIDHLFFWQDDHCLNAYLSEKTRAHLPKSYQ